MCFTDVVTQHCMGESIKKLSRPFRIFSACLQIRLSQSSTAAFMQTDRQTDRKKERKNKNKIFEQYSSRSTFAVQPRSISRLPVEFNVPSAPRISIFFVHAACAEYQLSKFTSVNRRHCPETFLVYSVSRGKLNL